MGVYQHMHVYCGEPDPEPYPLHRSYSEILHFILQTFSTQLCLLSSYVELFVILYFWIKADELFFPMDFHFNYIPWIQDLLGDRWVNRFRLLFG